MTAHRFKNGAETPLRVWIEPWCEEITVPTGSTLTIDVEVAPGEDDQTVVERTDTYLVVWCGGIRYEAELDGERLPT